MAALLALASRPAAAADRNAAFVEALRAAGWQDTAAAYVDWVDSSPLATEAFRKQLPLEQAAALATQARAARDRASRQRLYREAAQRYLDFAEGGAELPAQLDALRHAANLYAESAILAAADALAAPGAADAERRAARELFDLGLAAAERIVDLSTGRLAELPKPAVIQADPDAKALRDLLRDRQIEARFLLGLLTFEKSHTLPSGEPEQTKLLIDASRRFGELVEEYRDGVVGASSRFYQGRCWQQRGAFDKALGCYEDLFRP
ncbi:MAG TPA: hypothetical protein PKC18_20710, partial [Lacipirellulaceae bacterium]|nr:hypothetical protein [Lacipirellulaceae bacterium]